MYSEQNGVQEPGDPGLTPRQIAGRLNGVKGAGHKSDEGKAKSSQNAIRHGLTSFPSGDHKEEFEAIRNEILENLRPEDGVQASLVDRIALCTWRLRRVFDIETNVFGRPGRGVSDSAFQNCYTTERLISLNKYEANLERSISRTLRILNELKTETERARKK